MDKKFYVLVNTIEKVKDFVKIASSFDDEIDVCSGRYVIRGDSIMGMFSLMLTDPLEIEIVSNDIEEIERFNKEMEVFKI